MVEACLHLANVIYLLSFLGRDMLWLRVLTCAGLSLGVVFFSCRATPMYGPTAWHVTFLLINLYQIRALVLERRRLRLTQKQERVAGTAFEHLSREELLTLMTRTASGSVAAEAPQDIAAAAHTPLTRQEAIIRDIAFSHLSRGELLNLLTRRLWRSLVRFYPPRWRRAKTAETRTLP